MEKIFSKRKFHLLVIFVLVLYLFAVNYRYGTILMGWDNLQTELNPLLGIKRSFFAAWQEYQGLGLLGGMGHGADLVRAASIYLISFLIPLKLIRYAYHFSMLFAGVSGAYFLISYIIRKKAKQHQGFYALFGAFFYLFNLATLQMFYVPYEPLSTHFGFLPWLIFSNLKFINEGSRKNLILLILVNILATPQGYVGTIFIVYTALLLVFFLMKLSQSMKFLKNVLLSAIILAIVNSFWFLPNLHFILGKSSVNIESKSNQMVTQDNILKNKKYGYLRNIMIFKGFWFDNMEIDEKGELTSQMGLWIDHIERPEIRFIGYFLFLISLAGIFFIIKMKIKDAYPFIIIFFFSFSLLASSTPFLRSISDILTRNSLIKQALRTPFTKFSIISTLSLSIFYSIMIFYLGQQIKKNNFLKIFILLFLIMPAFFVYPIFFGNMLYSRVRAKLPDAYIALFDYFKDKNPSERVANFPQYTYWGWTFYRWNYTGSGFIWYGLEQPVLDRTFDVWSSQNENYYHEMSYALYSGNRNMFEQILEKYQISWLILDRNVISFSNAKELYWDKIYPLVLLSDKIALTARFGNVEVYRVNLSQSPNNFIFSPHKIVSIGTNYNWNNNDRGYSDYGNYYLPENESDTYYYYPFRSLFSGRAAKDLEFTVSENANDVIFEAVLPRRSGGDFLYLPTLNLQDVIEVDREFEVSGLFNYPRIYLGSNIINYSPLNSSGNLIDLSSLRANNLRMVIRKSTGLYAYDSNVTKYLENVDIENCDLNLSGEGSSKKIVDNEENVVWLRLTNINSTGCFDLSLPNLSHKNGYLVSVKSANDRGKSLFFSVINRNSTRTDLETYLPQSSVGYESYFVLPPMEEYGRGYDFQFKNDSIGNYPTENRIGRFAVYPVPYQFLTGLKIININQQDIVTGDYKKDKVTINHPNPSLYQVFLTNEAIKQWNNPILVLSQSFDEGWKAYKITKTKDQTPKTNLMVSLFPFWFGEEIKEHVLVNNWENGWRIGDLSLADSRSLNTPMTKDQRPTTIIIVYLPQYLQYLGFALWLFIPLLFFLVPKSSARVDEQL